MARFVKVGDCKGIICFIQTDFVFTGSFVSRRRDENLVGLKINPIVCSFLPVKEYVIIATIRRTGDSEYYEMCSLSVLIVCPISDTHKETFKHVVTLDVDC